MRRRDILGGIAALIPARALGATVLSTCGTANYTAGTPGNLTVDTTGAVCVSGSGSGGAPSAPTTVWSAADATANGFALSNGGLTVTVTTGALVAWRMIRVTTSKTSGKYYIETLILATPTASSHVGLASSGVNIATYLGSTNYSFGWAPAGNVFKSAGFTGPDAASPVGSAAGPPLVLGLAVDFTSNKVWVAYNNIWLTPSGGGAGDPASGANPTTTFDPVMVGPLFFAMSFGVPALRTTSDTWTLQPTGATQAFAPPAGFTPWDG